MNTLGQARSGSVRFGSVRFGSVRRAVWMLPFHNAGLFSKPNRLGSAWLTVWMRPYTTSSSWMDFREIWYLRIIRKYVQKIQVLFKSDKNDGRCTWRIFVFLDKCWWSHTLVWRICEFLKCRRRQSRAFLYGHKYSYWYACTVKQCDVLTVKNASCFVTECNICSAVHLSDEVTTVLRHFCWDAGTTPSSCTVWFREDNTLQLHCVVQRGQHPPAALCGSERTTPSSCTVWFREEQNGVRWLGFHFVVNGAWMMKQISAPFALSLSLACIRYLYLMITQLT